MKPVLRLMTDTPSYSFLVRNDVGEYMVNNWHYHPEVEILYIKKSAGTWLIGDHIGHYQPGDVVMIGANIPHCFLHDPQYINDPGIGGETICVKFLPDFLGGPFLNLPEAIKIKEALSKCRFGLQLTGKTRDLIGDLVEEMLKLSPAQRLLRLISMLERIGSNKQYLQLSKVGSMQLTNDGDKDRIKMVFDHTLTSYPEKITIESVASLLNMSRQSFCRYFKNKTKKTYIHFLMEVRIGAACRLLVEDEKNVAEICYQCGYNNISHFNHQFKYITSKKPLQYKKDYLKEISVY